MKKNVRVTFADGGTAVVAFRRQSPARIGIVLRAWGLLWQRDVTGWERTTAPAEYWYDGQKRHMLRFDDPACRDLLDRVIPIAVIFERRRQEVLALRERGIQIKEIAQQLKMPLSTVGMMLAKPAAIGLAKHRISVKNGRKRL